MENEIKAMANILMGRTLSKVDGRNNYVIRINRHDQRVTFGGMGTMHARGFTGAYLSEIREFGLSWAYFTYKKDALAVLEEFEKVGFEIRKI